MAKFLTFLLNQFNSLMDRNLSVHEGVEYSLKKYHETYKLLEEYDQKAIRDPEALANAGRLRPHIRKLKRKTGLRAYSSI